MIKVKLNTKIILSYKFIKLSSQQFLVLNSLKDNFFSQYNLNYE